MKWLEKAAPSLPASSKFVVKPHPACPVRGEDYSGLDLQITARPLGELLGDCDVAYTSYMTSAAVDAYCFGVPVVSVLDGDAFNISPLRGRPGVVYVTSPDELSSAVLHAWEGNGKTAKEPYFCLDKQLPRWRRLLFSAEDRKANQGLTSQTNQRSTV
jgi:surface carbohydrate biosynthesis protein (TIGR04326 family)